MKTSALFLAAVLIVVPWGLAGTPRPLPGGVCSASAQSRPPVPPPAVTLSEDTPTLEAVLAGYIEAVGGREALEKLEARVIEGRMVTDLPTWEPPVYEVDSLMAYWQPPERYVIIRKAQRGTALEGCDGTGHWKRGAGGEVLTTKGADPAKASVADPHFPVRLGQYFAEMTLLGTAMLDGRAAHVVDVDGEHLHRLYFDAESHLLLRLGYNTRLLDYREIDGVLMPFQVEYSRKGGSSTFVIDSVAHNAPLDDRLFVRPDTP